MSRIILARILFRNISVLTAALLAGAGVAQSQTLPAALPEDLLPELRQLLDSATKQSPNILSKNLEIAQAEANNIVERANLLPNINGYGSYSFKETSITGASNKSKNDGFFYGVGFSQPIFHWGALKAQADIGKIGVKMAEHDYAEAYRALILTVRSQYLTLIQKKMTVRNLRDGVRATESYLALQEARLRDGRISAGEILAPRLAVEESRIYAERAEVDFDYTRRTLATLTGVSEIPESSIPNELPKPAYAKETVLAYFEAMQHIGPDQTYMAAYYNDAIKLNDLRYKVARTRLLPKFGLSAGYSQENITTVFGNSVNQSAVTSLNYGVNSYWTIFDGLATRGAKLSALAAKRLAERRYDSYKKATGEQIKMLERQIGFAGRLMDLTDTRKDLAQAAVRKVSEDVKSGVSSQSILDNFTQSANKAELEALSARAEFLNRWAEYVSILGVDPVLNTLPPRYLRNGK
jgi:outer membrane protein, multidrug efflux system